MIEALEADGGFDAIPVEVGKSPGPVGVWMHTLDCWPVKQDTS